MPRVKLPTCDPNLKAPAELIQAVKQANIDKIQRILDKDPHLVWADHLFLWACRVPGYQGHGGQIAEEDAKDGKRAEIVRLFVALGAHPSMRNNRKVSPLHMAARFNLKAVAKALLESGADPNAVDEVRETPLFRAVNLGYAEVAELLLNGDADPNAANRKGYTPLHRAVMRGKVHLVPLLVENGANIHALDRESRMPIERARNRAIIDYLKEQIEKEENKKAG